MVENIKNILTNGLIECDIDNGNDYCKSGNNKIELKKISCGTFGITFVSTIFGKSFILKIQDIESQFNQKKVEKELMILRNLFYSSKNVPINPFFVNYYSDYISDPQNYHFLNFGCDGNVFNNRRNVHRYRVFAIEKFDGDFFGLLKSGIFYNLNVEEQLIIITKILLSIYSFHTFTLHYHEDTHIANFLFV